MALGIIFIFAMSSIAFVFVGFSPVQQNQLQPLDRYVVEGEIDPQLESAYIQNGATFLKFYYNDGTDRRLVSFVESAPEQFTTPSGQIQMFVLKIQSPTTYARILNINGPVDLSDLNEGKIFDALCSSLLAPPTECVIGKLNAANNSQ